MGRLHGIIGGVGFRMRDRIAIGALPVQIRFQRGCDCRVREPLIIFPHGPCFRYQPGNKKSISRLDFRSLWVRMSNRFL